MCARVAEVVVALMAGAGMGKAVLEVVGEGRRPEWLAFLWHRGRGIYRPELKPRRLRRGRTRGKVDGMDGCKEGEQGSMVKRGRKLRGKEREEKKRERRGESSWRDRKKEETEQGNGGKLSGSYDLPQTGWCC